MNLINIIKKYVVFLPFTQTNIIYHHLDKNIKTILDIGCGYGGPMNDINKRISLFTIGIDRYKPAIISSKNKHIHNIYILNDIKNLPIRKKSIDVILLLDVIEHLNKRNGILLLKELNKIARKQIIICTPVGFLNLLSGHKENPGDIHYSGWVPSEFKVRGYKVRGITGLKRISGAKFGGLGTKYEGNNFMNKLKRLMITILNYILRPLAYFIPNSAFSMFCIKEVYNSDT